MNFTVDLQAHDTLALDIPGEDEWCNHPCLNAVIEGKEYTVGCARPKHHCGTHAAFTLDRELAVEPESATLFCSEAVAMYGEFRE